MACVIRLWTLSSWNRTSDTTWHWIRHLIKSILSYLLYVYFYFNILTITTNILLKKLDAYFIAPLMMATYLPKHVMLCATSYIIQYI
jgi:hypothetical protein